MSVQLKLENIMARRVLLQAELEELESFGRSWATSRRKKAIAYRHCCLDRTHYAGVIRYTDHQSLAVRLEDRSSLAIC